ncbi:MAG: hypothetical protein ACI9P5_003048 [Saprospiraceae bacterium]|jgi:hypothetical protein
MKNFRILALFAFVAALSFTACKNEASDAQNAARESLATTATTTTATTTPATTPAQPAAPVGPLTSIEFEEDTYDFGEIMEGEKVVHIYKFKNTGKEPLVIANAKGSCGCTVPEWPREPIPVGGSGEIRVQFDSKGKGKVGGATQAKKVTLTANTDPANTFLNIKGKVNKPAES